jgi:hypothetical protein
VNQAGAPAAAIVATTPNPDGFSDQQIATIEAIVNRAVDRVSTTTRATPATATSQAATPQSQRQMVNVIEPRGPIKRSFAKIGERIANAGRPKVRTMEIAGSVPKPY